MHNDWVSRRGSRITFAKPKGYNRIGLLSLRIKGRERSNDA
ncbi:uncharacterized protein J3R85_000948 [Psidium guajava]|nr:uncharacterized protein J3R85_000948 [Psidium guajava]